MIIDTGSMFVILLFGRIVFLFPAVYSWSPISPRTTKLTTITTTRTISTSTLATRKTTFLLGVLSRSEIPKHTTQKKKKRKKSGNYNDKNKDSNYDSTSIKRTMTQQLYFLIDAVEEAMYRQTIALEYIELESTKLTDKLQLVEVAKENEDENYHNDDDKKNTDLTMVMIKNDIEEKKTIGSKNSDINVKISRVDKRRLEIRDTMKKLNALRLKLIDNNKNKNRQQTKNGNDTNVLSTTVTAMELELEFRQTMGSSLSVCSILDKPKESWKIYTHRNKQQQREFGRPRGFTGLVLYSSLGVPILVGKRMAHNDNVLRRIAQGSDMWFQVEDYAGSRVLLRTSLVRGMKGSKKCIQMAADIAATYSTLGDNYKHDDDDLDLDDAIPVMYTDSKHVAKRGTKEGQMRKRKSLGRLLGRPSNVKDITKGLEP